MGRQVRRAPLSFSWPVGRVWWGYLLGSVPCQTCGGTGKGPSTSKYGYCLTCEGEGKAHPKIDPPAYPCGKVPAYMREEATGWQMWETTSEGSPISPVLSTPEELARWLADNNASAFGSWTNTYEEWLLMINGRP